MWLIGLGSLLALTVPAGALGVAALWKAGMITPDSDGTLVQTLQALGLPSLLLVPVGLVIALWGAGVRSALGWTAGLLWGVPLLAAVWFLSAIWLGGLAGEPF